MTRRSEAVWAVDGSEPFFAGHFPGNPLIPGVLLGEALAQAAGLVAGIAVSGGAGGSTMHDLSPADQHSGGGKLAMLNLHFRRP